MLSKSLREQGADIIVAMTHMREPNDRRLAAEAGDVIDILLGGHDHHYWVGPVEPHGVHLLKSGTDFRDLTVADCLLDSSGTFTVSSTTRMQVTRDMPEDRAVAEQLLPFQDAVSGNMKKVIGETSVALDCAFKSIRTSETAIGNFVADCVCHSMENARVDSMESAGVDMCLINAGTLRADKVFPPGLLTTGDLVSLLPMLDPMVVLELCPTQLLEVLENGVSQWPALEGRFPCVSGVSFDFNQTAPSGSRVIRDSVCLRGKTLLEHGEDAKFTLATKQYLAKGKDGYTVFADCKVVIDEEEMPPLGTMVRHFFLELAVLNQFRMPAKGSGCVFSSRGIERVKERFQKSLQSKKRSEAATCSGETVSGEAKEEAAKKDELTIHPKIEGRIRPVG
jgi:5'-nucleotidase